MSEAIRCDRCEGFDANCKGKSTNFETNVNLKAFSFRGTYPSRLDLCSECRQNLIRLLFNWWNKPKKVKK